MEYPVEAFSKPEQLLLKPHFSNLDRPVFAIDNLPEAVKGALFARYSRYQGTLRRLFIDEFLDASLPAARPTDGKEGTRAAKLYDTVFLGYGDDSVAQLGGAHLACEYASNIITKLLQRGRLAAYLEQSTRYIPFDDKMSNGNYRYYRDQDLGPEFAAVMDQLFSTYSRLIPVLNSWAAEEWPRRADQPERAWETSIKAKSLDLLRGLLPAATLSHVGIFASGQAYEMLVMRLMASPLPEARAYGQMILEALQTVIPSFLSRVERPDRGGEWINYFERRRLQTEEQVHRFGLDARTDQDRGPSVELIDVRGDEAELLASCLYEQAGLPQKQINAAIAGMDAEERRRLLAAVVGDRKNRRHRPGRGFEVLSYRFEIVSDYGAFRDLQRHRMLTCEWQALTPDLGADIPEEIQAAGAGDDYRRALEISHGEYERLWSQGQAELAPYALCLGYRIRYLMDMNAREAMQLIELRSGDQGHPTYRAVAQQMHERIAEVHPAVADTMTYVDHSKEPRLERILSEIRSHHKLQAADSQE